MHFYVEIADRAPLPRTGEGGRGKGQMLPQATFGAHLCAVRTMFTSFVSSTAKRQRGLQRGKPGSPLPCFASFCRSKRKAPAASGANYAFAKGSATPLGEMKLYTGNPSLTAAPPLHCPLHRGAFRVM